MQASLTNGRGPWVQVVGVAVAVDVGVGVSNITN